MDAIKIATPEQVQRIAAQSDLGPGCSVLSMGEDLAVVRQCTELDPVFFAEGSSASRKLMFVWGIENMLRAGGAPAYYFNIKADAAHAAWRQVVETHGATQISEDLELRYKKVL